MCVCDKYILYFFFRCYFFPVKPKRLVTIRAKASASIAVNIKVSPNDKEPQGNVVHTQKAILMLELLRSVRVQIGGSIPPFWLCVSFNVFLSLLEVSMTIENISDYLWQLLSK